MGSLLEGKDLAKMIDECILDLKNGVGARLGDLAILAHTLAQATGKNLYYILPQIIGRFGNEVGMFHSLVDTPVLEKKIRDGFQSLLNTSVAEVCASLKTLKLELCKTRGKINYENILEALGAFDKNCYILHENRTQLMKRVSSRPTPRGLE